MTNQYAEPKKKAFELLDALAMASMVKIKDSTKMPQYPYLAAKKIAIEFATEMIVVHSDMRDYWQQVKNELKGM